jgi:tetratricopeptide (TPR) repeat protein
VVLIFDNADDINLWSSGLSKVRAANLVDYLPQSKVGSIIFTTTNGDIAKRLPLQNIIELGGMTPDTAQRMLRNYLNTPVSKSEQQEAKLLLQELSCLPLAIVQAAAYINTRNITLQRYRSLLLEQKEKAVERSSEVLEGKLQEHDAKGPVATTLLIAMDQIRCATPLAADYLLLIACVDRKDIPLDLLKAASAYEREDAIRILNSYALITRRPAESAIDIHQLPHRALRNWLQNQETLDQWTEQAIKWLLSVFPDHDHGNRSKWRRLLPHARYALSHRLSKQEGADWMSLVWKCAMALLGDGRYNEAEELFVQVMETRKRVLGDEHPDTLTSMGNLALTYWNQGRWKDAEELEVQVIETRKRVLGDEHPDTLTSIDNLASTYRNQGRWKDAEELNVQVIETRKRVLGDEHPDTLISIANLALTYWNQGRWKEAEELQAKELEICSRVLGDEHPDTLTSIANLASTYWNQGRWKDAEELEVQVMETFKRVLGDEHPDTLLNMANLAYTWKSQSRNEEAILLMEKCFELRKQIIGTSHPYTESSLKALTSWRIEGLAVQV